MIENYSFCPYISDYMDNIYNFYFPEFIEFAFIPKYSVFNNIENNNYLNNQEILNKNSMTIIVSNKIFELYESEMNFDRQNIPLNINISKDKSKFSNKKRQKIFSIVKDCEKKIEQIKKIFRLPKHIKIEDSPKKNKHNKYSPDNMRKRIKCFCFNTFIKKINEILKDIKNNALNKKYNSPINPLKLLTLDYNYITKNNRVDNLNLLKQSLKKILSGEVTGKFDNKEFHNKNLIENLYDIDIESDLENKEKLKKIKNFLNMKFENFFSSFLNQNDTNNEIIFESKEEFMSLVDIYLKNEDDEYKSKFKKMLINFPSSVEKMRCLK